MAGIIDELKSNFKHGGPLIRLIYVTLGVFIITRIVYLILSLSMSLGLYPFDRWFVLPANFSLFIYKPWTIITYIFYHEKLMHVAFNLLMLYWFGKLFNSLIGEKKLLAVFLLGGIFGGLLNLLTNSLPYFSNVIPGGGLLGASAGVMAIIIAATLYAPNMRVMLFLFGEVKLIYIGLLSVLIDVLMLTSPDSVGHVAHIGGALFGYIWVLQYKQGNDIASWFGKLLFSIQNLLKPGPKLRVASNRAASDMDYNKKKADNQKEIDRILDKISKGGYESLSKDEKETLFKMGDKNR